MPLKNVALFNCFGVLKKLHTVFHTEHNVCSEITVIIIIYLDYIFLLLLFLL